MSVEADEPDLLYGMKRIAQHLGVTDRQVEYMITKGNLPTFKLGKIICTTRSALRRHFQGLVP